MSAKKHSSETACLASPDASAPIPAQPGAAERRPQGRVSLSAQKTLRVERDSNPRLSLERRSNPCAYCRDERGEW